MATNVVAPQTLSPRVRIRSLSFDSPSEHAGEPSMEGCPLTKSPGSQLKRLPSYDAMDGGVTLGVCRSTDVLPPLNTKMSDESLLSDTLSFSSSPCTTSSITTSPSSSGSSSDADSDSDSDSDPDSDTDTPLPPSTPFEESQHRQRPHPLTFSQNSTTTTTTTTTATTTTITTTPSPTDMAPSPISPFLYQDTSCPMYSPWLVCAVLDMHDVRRLDWMCIAEPIERIWGVRTTSADVLGILSDNGRVNRRRWWD
ncbi:hypothetical protein ACJQWK_06715 [Exserohilum turcicum]|uniref:Uncharacterized protein n=1 Tax=Exserohilum turcicum (strain 28A) TaxID=671987 RepID=R0JWS8_EXST2|nr:uncharacterized protein SETTUDRAFT_154957 [Exserohilum turcica Et28A]EOA85403.1 hypothetical protein SETTUDRAFT_154957 [Exserohilum turcica Et28A]